MTTKKQPTPEQLQALQAFAKRHGFTWKHKLSTYWITGQDANEPDGGLLRQVRNEFGPSWLTRFSLPKEAPAIRTVDITPTWASILPVIELALRDGTPDGRAIARAELKRLARIADELVPALAEALDAALPMVESFTPNGTLSQPPEWAFDPVPSDYRHEEISKRGRAALALFEEIRKDGK
jgi:hypothetical protein